jgi:prephenate dehydrogenase
MLGRVVVVGCGLIGGSVVRSLRQSGRASHLGAVDRGPVLAAAAPYIDAAAEPGAAKARELVSEADLVVLAVPVFAIIQSLDWVLDAIRDDAVVTDTGSVKKPIALAARRHARGPRFVGGHPMAGREVGGFEAATDDLFEGSRWFLTSSEGDAGASSAAAIDRAAGLVRAVGAEPAVLEADAHDRAMAFVSHAPQLIASAVFAAAAQADVLAESGPGFRDLTRIAGGPAAMWRDIFESNRDQIAGALDAILEPLLAVRADLGAKEGASVDPALALLERAYQAKSRKTSSRRSGGEPGT